MNAKARLTRRLAGDTKYDLGLTPVPHYKGTYQYRRHKVLPAYKYNPMTEKIHPRRIV